MIINKMSSNNFKINRRTPAIYIGNESVNLVWKKNIEIEERTKENTARLDVVEAVANDADERSKKNRAALEEVDNVANNALAKTTENAERIEILRNRITNTNAVVRSHAERLSAVEGIAQEAKEQASQNTTRLDGVEGVANEAADLSHSNRELIGEIEGTANEANQRSKDNTGRLDIVQGVANEANERSKSNLTRLDSVDGTAKAAKTLAESNKALLNVVEGTANGAKALAESNQKLLSTVEGTANGAKALATECKNLIDGKANVEQVNYANVHLKMEEQRMFIVAPKGSIDHTKCEVSFARYVRSSYRVKTEHYTPSRPDGHYRRKGWIVPMWRRGTEDNRLVTAIVHMRMTKINEIDGMEYFLLSASPNAFDEGRDEATYTFDNNIGDVFLYLCKKADENKISLHLWDKKLGVCITMNGQPITPYLPFTVRFNALVNNRYGSFNFDKVNPSLSRWI